MRNEDSIFLEIWIFILCRLPFPPLLSLFFLWHGWKLCKIQHKITYERRKYVNHINFKLNLSCRGWILCGCFFLCCCCFLFFTEKIGLNIIKMMTPLRAYSCSTRQPTSIRVYRAVERAKSCTRREKKWMGRLKMMLRKSKGGPISVRSRRTRNKIP